MEYLLLLAMYAGPKKPAGLQKGMALLRRDLDLLAEGVEVTLADGSTFMLRVLLACTCQDYVGFRDMAKQSIQGESSDP